MSAAQSMRYTSTVSRPDGRGVLVAPRKVRTPQGRVLGNTQAGRPDGKWHRKDTAYVARNCAAGKGEMVR